MRGRAMKRLKRPRPSVAETRSPRLRSLPPVLELAIGEHRDKGGSGITLTNCLYHWSCFETERMTDERDEQLEDAIRWADKTHINSMLFVILHSVNTVLDTVSLPTVDDDSKDVPLELCMCMVVSGGRIRKSYCISSR